MASELPCLAELSRQPQRSLQKTFGSLGSRNITDRTDVKKACVPSNSIQTPEDALSSDCRFTVAVRLSMRHVNCCLATFSCDCPLPLRSAHGAKIRIQHRPHVLSQGVPFASDCLECLQQCFCGWPRVTCLIFGICRVQVVLRSVRVGGKELILLAVLMPLSHLAALMGFTRTLVILKFRPSKGQVLFILRLTPVLWFEPERAPIILSRVLRRRILTWSWMGIRPEDAVAASLVAAWTLPCAVMCCGVELDSVPQVQGEPKDAGVWAATDQDHLRR